MKVFRIEMAQIEMAEIIFLFTGPEVILHCISYVLAQRNYK